MDVPAVDDPRVQVDIPVPVKGRKTPLVLRLPRFDFIDEPSFADMMAATDAAQADPALTNMRQRNRAVNLAMLKPFVPAKDYAVCETLAPGQLDAVLLIWADASSINLGELLASEPPSPANTGAPSSTTSTSAGGRAATSDAA